MAIMAIPCRLVFSTKKKKKKKKKGLLEWTSGNGYHIIFLFRLIGMHFKAIYLCQNTSMLTEMHVRFRNEINSFMSVSLLCV